MSSARSSLLPKHGNSPFGLEVDDEPALVAHRLHLGVLDRRQAVGRVRQAGDAAGERAQDVAVVQRHLDRLVAVLVVHVVDDVERVDVGLREPVHHRIEAAHHLVVISTSPVIGAEFRPDLLAAHLVASAVEGVEQRLGAGSRARRRTASACRRASPRRSRRWRSRRPTWAASGRRTRTGWRWCRSTS